MSGGGDAGGFTAITGADEATARFFLDSAGGDLERAVTAFFESRDQGEGAPAAPEPAAPAAAQGPQQAAGQGAWPGGAAPGAAGKKKAPPRGPASKIATFADLGAEEEDSEDDEQNEYYAGGQKSGQVVKAPPGADKDAAVDEFFGQARQAGARNPGDMEDAPGGARGGTFSGTGRTLTGGETPAAPPPPQPITHTIAFYANGVFTVDDGPPRQADDPRNRPFLEAVGRGVCPPELEGNAAGVSVNLVRHNAAYEPSRQQPAAPSFQGAGQTLGGGSSSAEAPPATSATPAAAPGGEWEGPDESVPTTSVQLRMADGSRMVARMNLSHTVGDLRRFIAASRRDITRPYTLSTTFPSKLLADDSATIRDAGLANAVVVQKY